MSILDRVSRVPLWFRVLSSLALGWILPWIGLNQMGIKITRIQAIMGYAIFTFSTVYYYHYKEPIEQ